jgi:hypothetical protein
LQDESVEYGFQALSRNFQFTFQTQNPDTTTESLNQQIEEAILPTLNSSNTYNDETQVEEKTIGLQVGVEKFKFESQLASSSSQTPCSPLGPKADFIASPVSSTLSLVHPLADSTPSIFLASASKSNVQSTTDYKRKPSQHSPLSSPEHKKKTKTMTNLDSRLGQLTLASSQFGWTKLTREESMK